jgi:hypothetical protein
MSMIPVNRQKVTNFRTLCLLVFLPNLLSLFSLMYEGQLLIQLEERSIMLVLLMFLVNSLGSISYNSNMKSSESSLGSKQW